MTELEEKIYTAIGQASMCWSETPKGVFDDVAANKIAAELVKYINENVVGVRSWVYIEPIKGCVCKPVENISFYECCGENCINKTKSIN